MTRRATTPTATETTGFEFFEGTQSESGSQPQITVRRGGLMVLTRAAVDLLGEDTGFVQIGFNPKTQEIGIRSADEDSPGRYRLRLQPKGPARLIGGRRFFSHHGMTVDRAQSFEAKDFGNGIVGFAWTATEAPSKPASPRRRKKAS